MNARALVARNLRRLRVRKGLSQEVLAVDAQIDRTYVSRLERGLENPTVAVLERLAEALDGQIIEFLQSHGAAKLRRSRYAVAGDQSVEHTLKTIERFWKL